MGSKFMHAVTRLTIMSVLSAGIFLVQAAALPGIAHARCAGVNTPITSNFKVNGEPFAWDRPIAGTCNNNNYYQTEIKSDIPEWRVSLWIQNNGNWDVRWGNPGTGWQGRSYSDNNSYSFIHLCLDDSPQPGDTYTTICGWGNNYIESVYPYYRHDYYGVNHGF